jgi:hypothetical protein
VPVPSDGELARLLAEFNAGLLNMHEYHRLVRTAVAARSPIVQPTPQVQTHAPIKEKQQVPDLCGGCPDPEGTARGKQNPVTPSHSSAGENGDRR